MPLKISDYFDDSASNYPKVDYDKLYNPRSKSISNYLKDIGSKKIKNRIDILKDELKPRSEFKSRPLNYNSFNRKTDRNQILDWGSFRSRLNRFFDDMHEPFTDRVRAPTHDELTQVVWEEE